MQGRQAEGITEFYCPITLMRFENPVVAADGHTYEKAKIEELIKKGYKQPMDYFDLADKRVNKELTRKNKAIQNQSRALVEEKADLISLLQDRDQKLEHYSLRLDETEKARRDLEQSKVSLCFYWVKNQFISPWVTHNSGNGKLNWKIWWVSCELMKEYVNNCVLHLDGAH